MGWIEWSDVRYQCNEEMKLEESPKNIGVGGKLERSVLDQLLFFEVVPDCVTGLGESVDAAFAAVLVDEEFDAVVFFEFGEGVADAGDGDVGPLR